MAYATHLIREHGVDPYVFLGIYLAKSVVYYYTVYRVVSAVRRRHWETVPFWVLVNVTTNLSPWVYVYIYGRNLPWWFHLCFLSVLVYTAIFLGWEIRRRLPVKPPPEGHTEVAGEPAEP